jgi:putative addiction module component (TIGR02574 family)
MSVTTAFETLLDAALALPPEKRAVLLERLQESMQTIDPEWEAAWAREPEARLDAFERGEVQAIPAEEVVKEFEHL